MSKYSELTEESAKALALLCLLVAAACGALPFIGWLVNLPALRTFGSFSPPLHPTTALALISIAAALFALIRQTSVWLVRLLLAAPVLLGIGTMYIRWAGPYDSPLLITYEVENALPAAFPATLLLMLACAIGIATKGTRALNRMAIMLTTVSAALGAAPLTLMLEPGYDELLGWHPFIAPFPFALAATALSLVLLVKLSALLWPSILPEERRSDWAYLKQLLPVLLVPIVSALFELQSEHVEFFPPITAQLWSMSLNLLVLAILLSWSSRQASRQHAELEELTAALDTAPIIITDAKGCIKHWSYGCEQLYGWPSAAAIGRYKQELLRSERLGGSLTEDPSMRELTEQRRDGTIIHTVEQLRRVERRDGALSLIHTMTDITARVSAEAALRESQERLALATSAYPIGIFDAGVDLKLHWLPGSEEGLGIPMEILRSGRARGEYMPAEDLAAIEKISNEAIAQRRDRISVSTRFCYPPGSERAMQIAVRYFYSNEGDLIRIVGIVFDATEAHLREKVIAAREAQLRSILATVPDALIVTDENRIILTFSQAAEALFERAAQEVIGTDFQTLLVGSGDSEDTESCPDFRRTIGVVQACLARRADGTEIPIELRVGEAMVGDERLFTAAARDISQRLEAQARIGALQNDLTRVGRLNAVSELAAGLAHELNQPLAATVNFLATATVLLERKAPQEKITELLRHANAEALRAGLIIRKLREFIARRETDRSIEAVEPMIREAVNLTLAGQGQRHASVRYQFDPSVTHVLVDRIQIQQVIVNLVRNSMDAISMAGRTRGEIRISTQATANDMLAVAVLDDGPGITEGILEKLFQPFVSSKGDSGMGIGLSISRSIIEDHGGSLVAQNAPDGGALFVLTLPIARRSAERKPRGSREI